MSFLEIIDQFENFNFKEYFNSVSKKDIEETLRKNRLSHYDLLNLLSETGEKYLEEMAQKASELTVQYFGRTIQLFIPLYLSNYCTNNCIYCGFSVKNSIKRRKLTLKEIEREACEIAKTGMRHILILTGEAIEVTPLSYLKDAVTLLSKYFSSVSIEILPLEIKQYKTLKKAGVDGLTIYQEVYDRKIYEKVHLSGNKKDYDFRINTPENGALSGLRMINIGTLFGLGEKRKEAFFTALHAKYLRDKYIDTEISISLPRINSAEGDFKPFCNVNDMNFVQFLMAFRLFLPRVGITISTREGADFRDRLLFLGATRFSAGSKTEVGGYALSGAESGTQFDINDNRSVDEIINTIKSKGFQPVFKDWDVF